MTQLQVPLQARRLPVEGVEHIEIWQNGKSANIKSPISPYLISFKEMDLDGGDYKVEKILVKPLDTLKPTPAWKYSFPEVQYISKINAQLRLSHEEREYLCENHLGFLERVAIDCPEFFPQYPETSLSSLVFDIETASENHLQTNHIIAIAVSDGKKIWCHTGDEKEILESFARDWINIDPDVVVTYNGKYFDLPVVLERCKRYRIPINWVGRNKHGKQFNQNDEGRIHRIHGRVMFDVWEQVDSDQSIFGIKNKRLKTVAKWFKIPAIEEELHSTVELLKDPERLKAYCMSDVRTTEALYEMYQPGLIQVANTLAFPYDQIVNPGGSKGKAKSKHGRAREGSSMLIGRLVSGRAMVAGGFVEKGQNRQRYPEIYLHGSGNNYQGALVGIFKDGVQMTDGGILGRQYENILHVDFSGMYPSIQISVNISPETCKLLALEPYDENVDHIREHVEGEYTVFVIPDNKLQGEGRNAVIWVDQRKRGGLPQMLIDIGNERAGYKKDQKKKEKEVLKKDIEEQLRELLKIQAKILKSQQSGLKVVGNACGYGSMAPAEVRYGDVVCAILITGIARLMLKLAKAFIVAAGFIIIEMDTDGIYVEWGKPEKPQQFIDDLNAHIKEEVSKWGITSTMKMDADMYLAAYFYKMKNYVLRNLDGTLKWTGVAFKSAAKPRFYDAVRDVLAELKLNNASIDDVRAYLKKAMKIEKYSIPDLTMRRTISKFPDQYRNSDLGARLARLAEGLLGIPAVPHTQYEYVFSKESIMGRAPDFPELRKLGETVAVSDVEREVSTGNYMLAALAEHEHLDYKKYRGMVSDLANYFGYGNIARPLVRDPGITAITGWM